MRRYNTLNGKDLLHKLLIISNQEGKLSYDGTTLLPCNKVEIAESMCRL